MNERVSVIILGVLTKISPPLIKKMEEIRKIGEELNDLATGVITEETPSRAYPERAESLL